MSIFPEYKDIIKIGHCTERYIKKFYPYFYNYIIEKYKYFDISWKEKIYWYFHNIENYPVCKICGNKVKFHRFIDGYYSTCSYRCSSIASREKSKQTCLERYGVNHPKKSKEIIEKTKQTCLKKYGVNSYTQTEDFKIKSKQTCKEKYNVDFYTQSKDYVKKNCNTRLNKYGDVNYRNSEKAKQTCLERYGVVNPGCRLEQKLNNTINKEIIQQKIYQTKKKNKTFNSSSIEKQFELYLKENQIDYKTQYKSELYPFACDFYFPNYDLYLEIQGNWTHGGHPYNENNSEDLKQKEKWLSKNTKFYDNAITTWTIRDVQKRNIAKLNNLNYVECFTTNLNEIVKIFNFKTTKKSC